MPSEVPGRPCCPHFLTAPWAAAGWPQGASSCHVGEPPQGCGATGRRALPVVASRGPSPPAPCLPAQTPWEREVQPLGSALAVTSPWVQQAAPLILLGCTCETSCPDTPCWPPSSLFQLTHTWMHIPLSLCPSASQGSHFLPYCPSQPCPGAPELHPTVLVSLSGQPLPALTSLAPVRIPDNPVPHHLLGQPPHPALPSSSPWRHSLPAPDALPTLCGAQ